MLAVKTNENPPDHELTCQCGKRILTWDKDRRVAHEEPECQFFMNFCKGLKGHQYEGKILVIEPEEG